MQSSTTKKIVHFGKYYHPDVGGVESVTVSVAEGARHAGHAVSVVCFEGAAAPRQEEINGVQIVRAASAVNISSQPLSMDYVRKALRLASEADIVHLHAPNMLAALCSLWIKPTVRLLVHWHGDVRNKGLLGPLTRPLERRLLQRADAIVVTSEVYGKTSPALAPFADKIRIVPIGVSDPSNQAEQSGGSLVPEWTSRLDGKKLVLSVGRLVRFKGFDVLIDAARGLPEDVAIVIVGDGPLRAELEEQVRRLDLGERVLFTGSLPPRQSGGLLHELFKRADLYCLPSVDRSESFGVVLIEAMSYGTPCVVSDIPGSGVTWVSLDGVSGTRFPVGDWRSLSRVIAELLSDPERLSRLGEQARQRFLDHFTEGVATRRMLDVYASL
jgi:glycosyltransferase involved in cell wall biosynthesis